MFEIARQLGSMDTLTESCLAMEAGAAAGRTGVRARPCFRLNGVATEVIESLDFETTESTMTKQAML